MTQENIKSKKAKCILIKCTEEEKTKWLNAFGYGELSRKVRELLNKAIARKKIV